MTAPRLEAKCFAFLTKLTSQNTLSLGRAGFVGMKPVFGFHALLSLLKFLVIAERGASHFHFTLGPTHYVADPV